ncbi:hypothetical protein ABZT04_06255 [Streptomyces sp. NPDC005492]|uniref:hypothetical protein n=1 Tax=Streptomyces sp. NPDC005492 TaxID=3156883 RepID=UPI0033BF9826
MDPETAALVGTAGTTLVSLLTTEAWQRTRDGFAAVWRRAQPERAQAITAELDITRSDLFTAQASGDSDTRDELGAEWQGRIRRLITAHPEEAEALRALINELQSLAPAASPVTQHATAFGNARVYQAGRDQNFNQR